MEELNEKCAYVISTYIKNQQDKYLSIDEKTKKQSYVFIDEIEKLINDSVIKKSIADTKNNYYILLYLVIYENEYTTKYRDQIISAVLETKEDDYYNPILHILMMKLELSDKIIKRIIDITNSKYVEEHYNRLGNSPFDYRYHILKRKEISDELKNIILNRYNFKEYFADDEVQQIYYDILFELNSKKISSTDRLEEYPELDDEVRAYKLMKNYKINK